MGQGLITNFQIGDLLEMGREVKRGFLLIMLLPRINPFLSLSYLPYDTTKDGHCEKFTMQAMNR